MISFNQVCKRYPNGFNALKNIGFTLEAGEMALITGHSGAGKSTLLRLIAAIERPTSGSIIVNGQNVSALKSGAIPFLRRNLGLVFQDQKILFDRSVFDNVLLPLQISGFDSRAATGRVRAALDKVGLLDREKTRPITLSGGEQQRLCIARAIVNRPSILIADEPTSNLDADYARDIMTMFKSFHQVGVTVLIATHDVELLGNTPLRIFALNHGELTV
ncbi:cell division ATP-binding protein FtsE [Nitrosospira sp. Nsp5]|jgi:cell division transport system ATP-binding protein|uniref:Cell division ATP-binding protein FtsE n=1 Tax=Nitrosospira multiformis TaxID=1231 RepID=A0ABY0T8P7_9PROT|nr:MULTISPECIES: cell division ATP-binding protein FtsE [Nitrosospira]PTR06602.1 cell division ATP-binding protein FtsE [Nitrosospira sp. Nsp5]SDQ36605.1 cell division ATP-binding protein FtsE [Nitrosospira multiformis]